MQTLFFNLFWEFSTFVITEIIENIISDWTEYKISKSQRWTKTARPI